MASRKNSASGESIQGRDNLLGYAFPKRDGSAIRYSDGVSLTSCAHPLPRPWWRRLFARIRCWFPMRLSEDALEDIEIAIKPPTRKLGDTAP